MIKLNKKAGAAEAIFWTIEILFVLIPSLFIVRSVVDSSIEVSLPDGRLENYILISRIFYSKNSIFYMDSYTGRQDLHTIDINKFNESTLKQLFAKDNIKIGLRLSLNTGTINKEIFFNKPFYEGVIVRYEKSDIYDAIHQNILVTVMHDDKHIEKGILKLSAVFEVK